MSCKDLVAYWRKNHVNGRPPSRAQIDPPSQIPELLPNLLLVDAIAEGFRMRVIGSEIVKRIGRDNTGIILKPEPGPYSHISAMMGFFQETVSKSEPVYFSSRDGQSTAAGINGVLLPLLGEAGSVTQILGGIFYDTYRTDSGQRPEMKFLLDTQPPEA
jgi:hypothetical protein